MPESGFCYKCINAVPHRFAAPFCMNYGAPYGPSYFAPPYGVPPTSAPYGLDNGAPFGLSFAAPPSKALLSSSYAAPFGMRPDPELAAAPRQGIYPLVIEFMGQEILSPASPTSSVH
jgi:hypothetical protein